jgi:hypothetical protein
MPAIYLRLHLINDANESFFLELPKRIGSEVNGLLRVRGERQNIQNQNCSGKVSVFGNLIEDFPLLMDWPD